MLLLPLTQFIALCHSTGVHECHRSNRQPLESRHKKAKKKQQPNSSWEKRNTFVEFFMMFPISLVSFFLSQLSFHGSG